MIGLRSKSRTLIAKFGSLMTPPILSLRLYLFQLLSLVFSVVVLPFVLLVPFLLLMPFVMIFSRKPIFSSLAAIRAEWLRHACPQLWIWRFVCHVRRFHTASNDRIVLHYETDLEDKWDMPMLIHRFEVELDRLTGRFGSPLRGRVVVYLFSNWRDISKIMGRNIGGVALIQANAIVLADDSNLNESMQHEFAHLFSLRWSLEAPPLLREGICVWLQETMWGQSIDTLARPLLNNQSLLLSLLLSPKFFFAEPHRHACYVLAGSFSGYLIGTFGWERYRKLFRLCNSYRFRAKFKKCFGITFEKAESLWRDEIIFRESMNWRSKREMFASGPNGKQSVWRNRFD